MLSEFKYKSEVIGKNGISARIVAKSKSAYSGQEIVTWEYEAPKCILAELNTHGIMVKNAQSSRAVPVKKVIEQIRNNPVTPVHWGSNQAGMVAGEEIANQVKVFDVEYDPEVPDDGYRTREVAWKVAAREASDTMQNWDNAGYHKQIVNRIGEAFTFVKGVITATEIDNFFHLRYHPDADPYIQELARCMWEAYEQAEHEVLYEGEWHTPYVDHFKRDVNGEMAYINPDCENEPMWVTIEQALKISSAACGQVSYRKLDTSEETVERVWDRLMNGDIIHASVTGHQATPLKDPTYYLVEDGNPNLDRWVDGITHVDKEGNLWSAQFKHWVMHRKLIPNESCSRFHLRDKEKV